MIMLLLEPSGGTNDRSRRQAHSLLIESGLSLRRPKTQAAARFLDVYSIRSMAIR
jgi:hypothetical protein